MTFSHLAFPIVNKKMFTTPFGMRGGSVKKILIVISDGDETLFDNSDQSLTDDALNQLQSKGMVKIYHAANLWEKNPEHSICALKKEPSTAVEKSTGKIYLKQLHKHDVLIHSLCISSISNPYNHQSIHS